MNGWVRSFVLVFIYYCINQCQIKLNKLVRTSVKDWMSEKNQFTLNYLQLRKLWCDNISKSCYIFSATGLRSYLIRGLST